MRRSPVAIGIVLGLLVGGGAAAAIDVTSWGERGAGSASAPAKVALPPSQPTVTSGTVERLAAAFDVHGPVVVDADGWAVTDGNRLLVVQRAPGLPWFFSTAQPTCTLVPEGPPSSEALPTVPPSGPSECPDEPAPAAVVSKDDALALGTDTLTRAGLGPSTTDIVDEPGGWYIQASPQISGKPTDGVQWTISIGPGRTISAASGYLAVEDR